MPNHLAQIAQVPVWLGVVNVIGDVLWIIAYILAIRKGFQEKTYGFPMLCIALNLSWELIYAAIFRFPDSIIDYLRWAWLLLDIVIAYQLVRYGRKWQNTPLMVKYFYPVAVILFVSTFLGQLAFHYSFGDTWGMTDAYLINLIMSMLFIWMFFGRGGAAGQSLGVAWTKMLGTGILSAASCFTITNWLQSCFLVYLFISIFILDVIYILLLHADLRKGVDPAKIAGIATAAPAAD
jgi:hypothetical protein